MAIQNKNVGTNCKESGQRDVDRPKDKIMTKKKLILALALSMMLGGCGKSAQNKKNDMKGVTDTMLVIGVFDQPTTYSSAKTKCLLLVDKQGKIYEGANFLQVSTFNTETGMDPVLSYIERGDTVIMKNGKIVRNLTVERMANRYSNGR